MAHTGVYLFYVLQRNQVIAQHQIILDESLKRLGEAKKKERQDWAEMRKEMKEGFEVKDSRSIQN